MPHPLRSLLLLGVVACASDTHLASTAEIVVMSATTPAPPGGGAPSDLFVMNLDGSHLEQLTHDDELEFLPHFSPDATSLVYTKFETGTYGTPGARTDIARYDFASAREQLLTHTGDAAQAAWSPDGSQIAYLTHTGPLSTLWRMDSDGSNARAVGSSTGAPDDAVWGDIAWSSDDWILFAVEQEPSGPCFKARLDKIRPDGTGRVQVTDGGPSCTPHGMEQSGDADPGFSADGNTIYTSRGLPATPAGNPGATERKLVATSAEPWTPGKPERDLSLPSQPDCIEGVPKGSPDGTRILEFRACFTGDTRMGVFVTDTIGSYRTFVTDGFGPDWNPLAR
jgi:Tol biopolymer transport system component